MMSRPQLVLDVAGVIVTNLSSTYWYEVAQLSKTSYETVRALFKLEVRNDLWTGTMSEEEFWEWHSEHFPGIEPHKARNLLKKHLTLLPSIDFLRVWNQAADIHLLSNHRHEWLLELLEPISPYIQTITISSQIGCCKPDPAIYDIVQSKINSDHVIYVDDQEKNLVPARKLGWTTVIADIDGKWTGEVTALLHN